MKRANSDKFKRSLETQLIHDRLIETKIGEIVEYKEMNKLIGGDVQNGDRNHLTIARDLALRDENMVFATINNIGVKRMSDEEIAKSGDYFRKHIHRTADKAITQLSSVENFPALSNEAKVDHNTHMALAGALFQATKTKVVKRISAGITNPTKEISAAFINETLANIAR